MRVIRTVPGQPPALAHEATAENRASHCARLRCIAQAEVDPEREAGKERPHRQLRQKAHDLSEHCRHLSDRARQTEDAE